MPVVSTRRLEDLPAIIAAFPLAGAILLPHASLPLNIFEPRYLAMIDDALKGARMIGIVQPQGEGGETGSPASRAAPLRAIGCAGRLTAFQELPEGRMLISLAGICRFELGTEEDEETPYRRFRVRYHRFAHDLDLPVAEGDVDRGRLLGVLKRYLEHRGLRLDWEGTKRAPIEELVNALSVASPFGPAEKQALLEAETLKARAEALITLAEMELAAGRGGTGTTLQ